MSPAGGGRDQANRGHIVRPHGAHLRFTLNDHLLLFDPFPSLTQLAHLIPICHDLFLSPFECPSSAWSVSTVDGDEQHWDRHWDGSTLHRPTLNGWRKAEDR